MSSTQKIIVIAGPTASGKSGMALSLAEELDGVIINADSMQIYKDIPILAATPTITEQKNISHKLYGIYDASIRGNMVDWLNLAKQEIFLARQNNQTPIIVGGTGLYIETLIKGSTPIPETPEKIRKKIADLYKKYGLDYLYQELKKIDLPTAERLSPNDTTRIRRALEIWHHTGKNMSYWQSVPMIKHFNSNEFLCIYLNPPREILDIRARTRFDLMMQQGALDEVQALVSRNLSDSLPAMRALGVQELKSYLLNKCSLETAIENAKLHTRQYAKRQTTWFNNRYEADFQYTDYTKENKNFVDDIKKAL